jgi:hypothetical protein
MHGNGQGMCCRERADRHHADWARSSLRHPPPHPLALPWLPLRPHPAVFSSNLSSSWTVPAIFAAPGLTGPRAVPALPACASVCRAWRHELAVAIFVCITIQLYTSAALTKAYLQGLPSIAHIARHVAISPPTSLLGCRCLLHLARLDGTDATCDTVDNLQLRTRGRGHAVCAGRVLRRRAVPEACAQGPLPRPTLQATRANARKAYSARWSGD